LCQPKREKDGSIGKPPKEVIDQCVSTYLIPHIVKLNPNVIVPLGDIALRAVLKRSGITKNRGVIFQKKFTHEDKTIESKVIATFHPSYIKRFPNLEQYPVRDFRSVKDQSRSKKILDMSKKVKYKELKSLSQVLEVIKKCHCG